MVVGTSAAFPGGSMAMTRIVLDAALRTRLNNLDEPLEVCDESGRVLGFFHPIVRTAAASTRPQSPYTREEIGRFRQEQTARPLADILQDLERL
jgi:hypothetical protein